ncbi:hypothetical protein B6U67_05455 [Methanosarcinales archaeon ex4484_138]|nr:MAG: hypothetical protein B6U67_05455 [Methanosarcinales archaeon ex4484_138]
MIIGTRGSKLALAQATIVQEKLQASGIKTTINIIKTSGDRITDRPLHAVSGFGAFVREIDSAMLAGEIELAVHSMKDVPTERPDGLVTAAVLKRDSPFDALITRDGTLLDELPHAPTRLECDVERIIISVLGGGCSAPVAAFAEREGNHLHVTAEVLSIDATRRVRIEEEIPVADYALHSRRLGEELKVEGGGELVDEAVQYFSDVRGDI